MIERRVGRRARLAGLGLMCGVGTALVVGLVGCAAPAAEGGPENRGAAGVPEPPGLEHEQTVSRDAAAIRAMSGVFDVTISVAEAGAPGVSSGSGSSSVSAREAVVLEPGGAPGRWVLEHLLLVGEPAAVARHWSSVWTPVEGGDGRWRVVEVEADGRPSSAAAGRWVHEALGGPGGGWV
ncbi:MAG: hypothetical protein AAGE65_12820, partial [Planctomycetota bacterium]